MVGNRFGNMARVAMGLALLTAVAFGAVRPAAAVSTIIYVNAAASGANNGTSWTDAYKDLQTAIGASGAGERIWVAAGTYKPTTTTDRSIGFEMKSGLAIIGGFGGTETNENQHNPRLHPTILSGDIGTVGVASDNSYHVVLASGTDSSAELTGFTVTGGHATGSSGSDQRGGGMLIESAYPRISDMIFTGNGALLGGGMYTNISSHPTLDNVTFSGNAASFGAGMFNNDTSYPTLTNVTFQGNTATGVGAEGGAMFNWDSSPTIYNGTFSGNTAVDHGGGIYNFSNSMPFFYDSILWDGAPDEVYNNDTSTPTIFDSIVKGGCPASSTCMNVLNANPVLGPLQNNGGFTKTMALGSGSPAIDRGSNISCAVTDQRGVARPQGGKCDLGAYEVKTKTFRSVGASDGWVLESSENSSVGGSMNASATTLRVGDDAANRQYRGVLSFNTSPLPDAAAVVLAKVSVEKQGLVGTNPFTTHSSLLVDVVKPFFGAGVALAISDFQAAATASAGGSIGSVPSGAWYNGTLNSAGRAAVNKTGTTQLRLRFKLDDNNDHGADYLSFFSGNAPASPDRPLLLVYYNP